MENNMKTERYAADLIGVSALIISAVIALKLVSELENFSRNGQSGVMMQSTEIFTKPVGELFGSSKVRQLSRRDLDFPPGSESLEDRRLYADTVIRLKLNK